MVVFDFGMLKKIMFFSYESNCFIFHAHFKPDSFIRLI